MVKEKDLEILERVLKEALERVGKMKKEIAPETVTKVKMIDGLTGDVIHVTRIKDANPPEAKITQCKASMINCYLGKYVFNHMLTDTERDLVHLQGWSETLNSIIEGYESKVKEALEWEVYQDVE